MITKGLKNHEVRVTFEGDKHPTSGCVIGFDWNDIKLALEKQLGKNDKVLSFKVTDWGIEVFHDRIMTVQEGRKVHKSFTGCNG